jgi:hypothetical protein
VAFKMMFLTLSLLAGVEAVETMAEAEAQGVI